MASPDSALPRRAGLLDYTVIAMMTMVLVAFFAPFDKPDITSAVLSPNRIFEAALVLFAFAMGVVLMVLIRRSVFHLNTASLLFVLFCMFAVVSTLLSARPIYSLQKVSELFALLLPSSAFAYIVSRRGTDAVTRAIAVASLLAVIYTLVTNLVMFGNMFHMTPGGSIRKARLLGVFGNPTEYSDLICLCLIALACSRRLFWLPVRIGAMGLLLFMLYLTDTRSAMLATLAAAFLGLFFSGKINISRFVFFFVVALLGLGTVVLFVSGDTGFSDVGSFNGRTFLWEQALSIIANNPVFGVGYGDSGSHLIAPSLLKAAGSAHSSFFEIGMTTGITGLTIMIIFLVNAVVVTFRSRQVFPIAVVTYVIIRSLFDHLIFATEVPTVFLLVILVPVSIVMQKSPAYAAGPRGGLAASRPLTAPVHLSAGRGT